MDREKEQKKLWEKIRQLSQYSVLVRNIPTKGKLSEQVDMTGGEPTGFTSEDVIYLSRMALQFHQLCLLWRFSETLLDNSLRQLEELGVEDLEELEELEEEPEGAAFALENLNALYDFIEEYTRLLKKEYKCCNE